MQKKLGSWTSVCNFLNSLTRDMCIQLIFACGFMSEVRWTVTAVLSSLPGIFLVLTEAQPVPQVHLLFGGELRINHSSWPPQSVKDGFMMWLKHHICDPFPWCLFSSPFRKSKLQLFIGNVCKRSPSLMGQRRLIVCDRVMLLVLVAANGFTAVQLLLWQLVAALFLFTNVIYCYWDLEVDMETVYYLEVQTWTKKVKIKRK